LQFRVNKGKEKNPQSYYSRDRSRHCRRARAGTIQRAFSRVRLAAGFSPRLPRISRLDERVAVIYGPPRACSSPFAETVPLHCTHRGVYQRPPPSNETLHRITDHYRDLNINPAPSDVRLSFETHRRKHPASHLSEKEMKRNSTRCFCSR